MIKSNAYITLLDNTEYIYSVIACYSSWLKTKSKYPFYCACTRNVPMEIRHNLIELNINIINLPEIAGLDGLKRKLKEAKYNSWIPALAKLAIYGLDQFDKLIFLDADTYIYKNLDHLFEKPHMTAVPDGIGRETKGKDKFVKGDNYFLKFNAGMTVIEPSKELFDRIIASTKTLPGDRPWADQMIVSELYPNWINEKEKQLPVYYNCFGRHIYEYEQHIKDFSVDKICVLHLVGKKLSPTYGFENIIDGYNNNKHSTYYKLIHQICLNVNAFIASKQKIGKLQNLKFVKVPWQYDLVVPYVDATDPKWVEVFNKYNDNTEIKEEVNAKNRFRGQGDFFRYFFRGIEKNMPWINNIFLLVASESQVPNWLDTTKVKVITHDKFIPKEYLPTFNSCTIELFLHNIPGLSERFVYANDDFFVVDKITVNQLFNGDTALTKIKTASGKTTMYDHHCINCYSLIFNDVAPVKYLTFEHTFRPYFKSSIIECFNLYQKNILNSITRFRDYKNYNCYLYLEYLSKQNKLAESPLNILYCDANSTIKKARSLANTQIVCLNDSKENNIYEDQLVNSYFAEKFPNKSIYELSDYTYKNKVNIAKYIKAQTKTGGYYLYF